MAKTGRNAHCPCGSGKKYKHCCLAQETAYQSILQEQFDAKMRAVAWLFKNYADAVDEAVMNRFFLDEEDDRFDLIAELSESMQLMVLASMHDWLIGDAELILSEGRVRASELLLGPGGPLYTANDRRHIEELAASELSIYEVLEVRNGEGLLLRDMLRPEQEPVFAYEKKATKALVPWDTLGARVLRRDEACTLGGGIYPFQRTHAVQIVKFLQDLIKRESRKKRPKLTAQEIITFCIIDNWLDAITAPPSAPMLIDARTNEPLLYTMDRYRVSDWRTLKDALNGRDDVEWEDDSLWLWVETINEQEFRSLARLERLPSGVLEVECRTVGMADTARKWLENLVGAYVSHMERKTEDPREILLNKSHSPSGAPDKEKPSEIPIEIQREVITKYLANHYEQWPNMPLPALKGKTPLQAAKLKTYRPELVELLKHMEQSEAKRAKNSGMPAFDIGFLWERFGLTRE